MAIITHTLDCGTIVLIEHIDTAESAAISWAIPAGSASDPPDGDGHSAFLCELILRGAGGRTSRELSDALDRLGVQRSTDVQTHHLRIDATMIGRQLTNALPILVDILRDPMLPENALEPVRSLCLQELISLDDDPQHLVMLRVRERHHPPPFNRHGYGERKVLETATIDQIRNSWKSRALPGGSLIGVAGAVNPETITKQLDELLKGWQGSVDEPTELAPPQRGYLPIEQTTSQVHIGLACDAPNERDPQSMVERLAVGVLSGSTSGRLFTEVRQKRSLCYSVGASYQAGRDRGIMTLYAGTTPERAQQTLDVCLEELQRLSMGATPEEFHRATVGLKSRLIMRGESTPARAASLIYDQYRLGRARTLEEVSTEIDAVTLDSLNEYLATRVFDDFTIASIGPTVLKTPEAFAHQA